MLMTALGAIGGAALAGGLNLAGTAINSATSWYYAKKQAALEYEYKEKTAKNEPSWNVEGLERAGLNPILATHGTYSGGVGVNSPHVSNSDLGNAMLEGANAAMQVADTWKDINKKEAETNAIPKQADAAVKNAEANLLNAQTQRANSTSAIAKNLADANYSRALAETEDVIRNEKVMSEGRKHNNSIYNALKDAGKRITDLIPSERADLGVIHSAKSVPPDPNKTILKGMSPEEKEKYYLDQIRKRTRYLRGK